jgi:hypothetical protein
MTTASTIPTLDSADRKSATGRTPIPEIIEALKRVPPLHGMEQSEYEWLAAHGVERFEPVGTTLFEEGDPATTMNILLRAKSTSAVDAAFRRRFSLAAPASSPAYCPSHA